MRKERRKGYRLVILGVVLLTFVLGTSVAVLAGAEEPWWPVKVRAWYGVYDGKGKQPDLPPPSLEPMKIVEWSPPMKASRPWKIGVAMVHLKDPYWLTLNEGLVKEARRLGLDMTLMSAGGYTELTRQQEQVENLVSKGMDGIILCSISYNGNDALIKEITKRGIPVVTMSPDVLSPDKTACITPSFYVAGNNLVDWFLKETKGQKGIKVVWLPGPPGATWTEAPYNVFVQALKDRSVGKDQVEIVDVKWGDSGMDVQLPLIEGALQRHPKIDYVIGCAPGAEAALRAVSEVGLQGKTKIISTYLSPPLLKPLMDGKIIYTTYDSTKTLGLVPTGVMVNVLEGKKPGKDFPFRIEMTFMDLTPEIVKAKGLTNDDFFAPKDWSPVFRVKPE